MVAQSDKERIEKLENFRQETEIELVARETRTLKVWGNLLKKVVFGHSWSIASIFPAALKSIWRLIGKRIGAKVEPLSMSEAAWHAFGRMIFFPAGSATGTLAAVVIPFILTILVIRCDREATEKQVKIDDAARRSSSAEVVAILDAFSDFSIAHPLQDTISRALIDRIIASTTVMRPYHFLDADNNFSSLIDEPLSPERGSVLVYLMQRKFRNQYALMSEAVFEYAEVRGAKFAGARKVEGGRFNKSDWRDCSISRDTFIQCDFSGARFDSSTISFSSFPLSTFFRINFAGMNLLGENYFNSAVFLSPDFRKTKFSGLVSFNSAQLDSSNFKGVIFEGPMQFSGADLTDADFSDTYFSSTVSFSGAILTRTKFEKAKFMKEVSFQNAILDNCDFKECTFASTTYFDYANLSHIDFEADTFQGPLSLSNSNIIDINVMKAYFKDDVILDKASIQGLNAIGAMSDSKISVLGARYDPSFQHDDKFRVPKNLKDFFERPK